MRHAPLSGLLWGTALLAGCELTEVTTSPTEDVLVVEATLRAGEPIQRVLLHRSLHGGDVLGETDAQVSVTTAAGRTIPFEPAPRNACTEGLSQEQAESVAARASCYLSAPTSSFWVQPGEAYELSVVTRLGARVRGRTTVPAGFDLRSPHLPISRVYTCRIPPETTLPLVWTVAEGAWSYLAVIVVHGLDEALAPRGIVAPRRLELTGLAISATDTTMVLPTDFGIFERLDVDDDILRALQGGFPDGTRLELVVAAADRNFVNAVRGGGFNPSGAVRISSVVGDGLGFFGSLVPLQLSIVVGDFPVHPPCQPSA